MESQQQQLKPFFANFLENQIPATHKTVDGGNEYTTPIKDWNDETHKFPSDGDEDFRG